MYFCRMVCVSCSQAGCISAQWLVLCVPDHDAFLLNGWHFVYSPGVDGACPGQLLGSPTAQISSVVRLQTDVSEWGIRAEGAPSRSAEGAPSMAMSADRRECAAVRWSGQRQSKVHHGQRYARTEVSTLVYGDGRGKVNE